ncbi:HEAT repeat domain-containing protein [Streptomyces sp. NRRL F-2580]|uniref:HEAT repeat domain-containing protein n=1 Tax=Streptomyces sp. NRRL F-2580 TaxID=1463841 RepID=UPI0004CA1928|nr:HEAT repeat domain-containing protein [Streptomyces sp. NRRL F-2580]
MTTPTDQPFDDAVRRADVGWLSGHLDARLCPPAVFGRLIRHEDPRLRYLGLVLLDERVTSGRTGDASEAAELARLLPMSVEGSPESLLVLARLHERLGPYVPGSRRPSWRTVDLPVRVRIAWLRAELMNEPTVIRKEPPGELLYQAVRQATVTCAHRPAQLVNDLMDSGDPVLQAEALRLAREGLHAGLLAPALVRGHVIRLLGASGGDVVAAALGELAEPWMALESLPPGLLTPFLTAESVIARPDAAGAALTAAAHHGHGGLLRQVIDDPDLPPGLRRRGMELLGDLADRGDIGALTAIAARDPLLFGGPAVRCLRGLHRRGHFPEGPHVPSIIGLALADHTIAAHEIATILFTCRQVMLRELVDVAADDPSWPRRLALLVALSAQGAGELPIGDAITRVLPSAPVPGPFLAAIRALRHADAEDAVLALLPSAPTAALDALEAIGGHRTVTVLREGLGVAAHPDAEEGAGVIAPHLRAVRNCALEVLWHLTDDPSERRALLVRLDPADLPARIAADLGGPDEQELALLSSHLDPDQPEAALCRLAAHGSAATLPAIADLLLRVVAELAASSESGTGPTAPANGQPAGEPVVPQEVLDAVHGLGRRLHERGRIRPACLLDAATAREAGHALVASLALDLLDRPGLSGGEQAILLELLLRAPSPSTRARTHRLLRHRDRHVRKHVIALLARDTTGDDAQALSATLIALTAAQDVQTVRQALLALGHARARWASAAIAACLGHPNMNIKKTAAEVLVRAGTPTAVPALLHWLGHHDNPGLRAGLIEALRAILGDAYRATVLAAAEHSEDGRARELLLEGLDRTLPASSVLALHHQASRVAPTLLALVAAGRVGLASGTIEDLSTAMATYGITMPTAPRSAGGTAAADLDVSSLTTGGWNPSAALRIAERHELPCPSRLRALRPMLADWLRLAASEPAARGRVLRLTLRLCPAPWTTEELTAFSRSTTVLLDGLAEASAEDRHDLIAVLEAVAPTLSAFEKSTAADAVRALPSVPAGNRSTLPLLRGLGAVLVRADLDRALASARLDADPRQAETAVLRDAFAVRQSPAAARPDEEWRTALAAAARTPSTLQAFRRHPHPPGSRDQLTALIDVHTSAGSEVRAALIDWMTDLQPLDAPPWTITETTHAPAPRPRTVHVDDLDQPRSTALRERLLAMLRSDAPDRWRTAALALLEWPEPEAGLPVLRAFLHGHIDVPVSADLARTLSAIGETELRADGVLHDRVALVAERLAPCDLGPLVPLLLEWWEHDPPAVSSAAAQALRRVPADVLAERLTGRLDTGARGFLDLLSGRPLLRTPTLTRIGRRLRAEGRDDLADRLLLVDGPLRHPDDSARQDAAALTALRERTPPEPTRPPSRQDLLTLARTGDPARIHQALTQLTEAHPGPATDQDPELRDLISELLHHPKPGIRLRAHRTSRALLDRPTYLHHTSLLLADPQPDLVRTAIRTLTHAPWPPAIPAMTALLEHPHPTIRKTATEALITLGKEAVPALKHAATHTRPDKRPLYTDLLNHITHTSAPDPE